jgi:hypothetical protein
MVVVIKKVDKDPVYLRGQDRIAVQYLCWDL